MQRQDGRCFVCIQNRIPAPLKRSAIRVTHSNVNIRFQQRAAHAVVRAAVVSQNPVGGQANIVDSGLDLHQCVISLVFQILILVGYRLQDRLKENARVFQSNAMRFIQRRKIEASPKRSGSMGCPVYVMLPLDTISVVEHQGKTEARILKENELTHALDRFKLAGVHGIMVDIWWGIVERDGPKAYDFSAYRRLFEMASEAGLKLQAVMSFHAAGSNVGDTCEIPLPKWVLDIGYKNPDIFYTDRQGFRNEEYLSLGCDEEPLFYGRAPVDMYRDFVDAFANEFESMLGNVITEITVGLGPAGELRYPAYPEGDGRWSFPGVGEFQCYDKYMLASLQAASFKVGREEW